MTLLAKYLRETQADEKKPAPRMRRSIYDSVDSTSPSVQYTLSDMKVKAAAAVQTWCETDDLSENETSALRLQSLLIGIVDANKDGEIGDDEADYFEMVLNAAWDYLAAKGAQDDDIDLLLNDWDTAAADRIMDVVNGGLPDGDEAGLDDIDAFAFSDDDQEAVFDSAAYKNVMAIRHGKKMRIKKRIGGTVRLSAAQKVAIRKMHMKSHSATAQIRRLKSVRMSRSMGL
jgi:hypothetical protein